MRAFAVIMMVQGHTVDVMLGADYRTADSVFYTIWHTMRGFTAPIFMFTAGVAFTYLLTSNNLPLSENPRVKKGLLRFLTLVLIGYILRYPTHTIFDFSNVSEKQWLIFFAVDALHLIGFGLLFIIGFLYIAEKIKVDQKIILAAGVLIFFAGYQFTKTVEWIEIFPIAIASYFTRDFGSYFPLFPWVGYVLAGAVLGTYLAQNKGVQRKTIFGRNLFLTGSVLVAVSFITYSYSSAYDPAASFLGANPGLMFFRLGIVLILNAVVSLLVIKIENIPNIIKEVGKHTLLIYVVHLVILYGSTWSPGISKAYYQVFSPEVTLAAALIMETAMITMVYTLGRFNKFNKFRRSKKLAAETA